MSGCSPFCAFLVERWRTGLFSKEIFPGFPFRPAGWRALAFNRDTVGNIRLPEIVWHHLFREVSIRTCETVAFVASPQPITGGIVAEREQPFVVALDVQRVLAHFSDMSMYLPEFFMAGGSEHWAVWGDSDLTVLGGEFHLISTLIEELGGESKVIEDMARDFGLDEAPDSADMWAYLKGLARN